MMTMRERRILAEAQESERRVLKEYNQLTLYAGPEKTVGDLLKINRRLTEHGYAVTIEWLRDSKHLPFGVRIIGRMR